MHLQRPEGRQRIETYRMVIKIGGEAVTAGGEGLGNEDIFGEGKKEYIGSEEKLKGSA